MNIQLKRELIEIFFLSIIREKPMNGYDLMLKVDERIGLENMTNEWCFNNLRNNGYCDLYFEEKDGKAYGMFSITQKGKERLQDFLDMKRLILEIYESL